MSTKNRKLKRRQRIKTSIRKRLRGTPERPRLTVYRSNSQIYAQIVDDTQGKTLIATSSLQKDFSREKMTKTQQARIVGVEIARKALEAGITAVVFDRNGFLYHGRVKALADAARENGLIF
ncbi:MAG TPA: 50S ribosomal protein L18 [Bacteroidales bacterium]|jgi:large subunit ribosomal protein L18|nr:50S ribosomal protein L18 [Bacteroidales bacterium]MDI9574341.1 50S ribosomal protein L18 [Bacteroidota bacterium]OQC61660.1 MAG: 50S ribosomal protein L18 [Bacteroidetes bacterium ADurb.Bin012]MBP9512194.1 50S ribosomal protein L18 [Bacteroidales bacterium]MBP9587531.1 50S ribosomal protein L18 [Bacteroidales bacterium]